MSDKNLVPWHVRWTNKASGNSYVHTVWRPSGHDAREEFREFERTISGTRWTAAPWLEVLAALHYEIPKPPEGN
jgi:hypothetical protein